MNRKEVVKFIENRSARVTVMNQDVDQIVWIISVTSPQNDTISRTIKCLDNERALCDQLERVYSNFDIDRFAEEKIQNGDRKISDLVHSGEFIKNTLYFVFNDFYEEYAKGK